MKKLLFFALMLAMGTVQAQQVRYAIPTNTARPDYHLYDYIPNDVVRKIHRQYRGFDIIEIRGLNSRRGSIYEARLVGGNKMVDIRMRRSGRIMNEAWYEYQPVRRGRSHVVHHRYVPISTPYRYNEITCGINCGHSRCTHH